MNLNTPDALPLVSVIIPVYNVEAYLRECIDSVIGQTYTNLEILLIDDGSPDGCGAICDEYALADPRIKVIHQQNGGLSAARNTGLDHACGEFICVIDSDDFIDANMIEILSDRLIRDNADLVICDIALCHNRSDIWSCDSPLTDRTFTLEEFVEEYQAWQYIVAWNKLYRRSLFRELRYPAGYIHEDNATIHRILGECRTIATVPERLYFYRQRKGSITNSNLSIKHSDALTAFADQICYAYGNGWNKMADKTASDYVNKFFELYFRFPKNQENTLYFHRMDASLRKALPCLLRSSRVSLRHKVYLSIIRVSPGLFLWLQRITHTNAS